MGRRFADLDSAQDALVAVAGERVDKMRHHHQHELEQLRGFLNDCRDQLKSTQNQLAESEGQRASLSTMT